MLSLEPAVTVLAGTIWLLIRGLAWSITVCVLGLGAMVAYRVLLHPLASVPGPKLAAVSNVWHAYHVREGRMAELGRTLHSRYGPAVRVGPNEVWFNSKSAFKAIYSSGSGFEKSDFYLATALARPRLDWNLEAHSTDSLDLLSERDMRRYRLQRRLIGPVYRPSNVNKYEVMIDSVLRRVIPRLRSLKGAEVDLKEWMHIVVVECLGAAVLSWSPGMLDKGTDHGTSSHSYQGWRRKSVQGLFPTMSKLQLHSKALGQAFSQLWGLKHEPPPGFKTFFPDVGRRVSQRIKAALRSKEKHDDLAADLIRLHREKPDFTDSYLRKMIITNFGAGHETLASTLTSLVAMTGSHKQVHGRVTAEARREAGPLSYTRADGMPYISATIKESKRLHPVLSMSLPRTTPSPGLHLHGFFIPPGTTVGCNPIALHRNEDVCGPDPDAFDPGRWLRGEHWAREMELFSLAWGGGARTCPGRHLAELIAWKVYTAIVSEFDVVATVPEDCSQPSYFLSIMTGVRARFIPVDGSFADPEG